MLPNQPGPGRPSPEVILLLLQLLASQGGANLSEGGEGGAFDDFGKSQVPGQSQGPNYEPAPNGVNVFPSNANNVGGATNVDNPFRFSAGLEALINADPVPASQTANVPLGPGGALLPWVEQQRMAQMSSARRQQNSGARQPRGRG
jgi:hypothetical protein